MRLDFSQLPDDRAAIEYQRMLRDMEKRQHKVKLLEGILAEIEGLEGHSYE